MLEELNQIPEVFGIDENYDGYYLLREIRPIGDSQEDSPLKIVIVGDQESLSHYQVAEKFSKHFKELWKKYYSPICGGGEIRVLKSEKEMLIYGVSGSYGKADHKITKEILERNFPDYTVIILNM